MLKLSRQQKCILRAIYKVRKYSNSGKRAWIRERVYRDPTRSQSASFSRSLKRLTAQGLIEPRFWTFDDIKPTKKGEKIIKGLIEKESKLKG